MAEGSGQISIYEMLGMDDTPEIPFEKQKQGMKGWVIEIGAVFLKENGFKKDMVGVTTVRVILERDSNTDSRGRRGQYAHVIEGGCKGDGWYGQVKKLYARRPTWRECVEYARQKYKEPFEVVYVYKDGHAMTHMGDYEANG